MGVSENRGTLFGGPFKGILFYLGCKRDTPVLGNAQIVAGLSTLRAFLCGVPQPLTVRTVNTELLLGHTT